MFALWGENSQTYITYHGRILLHQNYNELRYMTQGFGTCKIVEVKFPLGRPWMFWQEHPSWMSRLELEEARRKEWLDQAQP